MTQFTARRIPEERCRCILRVTVPLRLLSVNNYGAYDESQLAILRITPVGLVVDMPMTKQYSLPEMHRASQQCFYRFHPSFP